MGWADIPFFANSWQPVFFEAMALRPDLIDRWCAAQQAYILQFLEAQLQRGADLILGGQDICDTRGPMFSPRHYERWFQPFLLAITEMCHRYGIPYLRHNDGELGPLEEVFLLESGIDGWHAIEPNAGNDIFYFKEKYGDRIVLAGNVDCASTLVTGTPQEVYNETRDKILGCAPGGGYILSSSNSIHNGVPGPNYMAIIGAWRDYGTYPIRK
jgi:uroporphyrinogen decarboxylase